MPQQQDIEYQRTPEKRRRRYSPEKRPFRGGTTNRRGGWMRSTIGQSAHTNKSRGQHRNRGAYTGGPNINRKRWEDREEHNKTKRHNRNRNVKSDTEVVASKHNKHGAKHFRVDKKHKGKKHDSQYQQYMDSYDESS